MERLQEEAVRNEIAFVRTLTQVWCIPCVSREGFIYKKLFQWCPFAFRWVSNIARLQDEGEDLSEDQRLRTQDSGRILRAALFLSEDAVQPRIRRQVQTLQQVHPCGLLHANISTHDNTLQAGYNERGNKRKGAAIHKSWQQSRLLFLHVPDFGVFHTVTMNGWMTTFYNIRR